MERKPTFDPSKPFKSADEKPPFDPSKAFEPADQAPVQTSPAQTATESFGNAATMGYLPHMQAGVEKYTDAINSYGDSALNAVGLGKYASQDSQLREKGFQVPEQSYTDVRDQNIKRQALQTEQNPGAALAGGIGGAVSSAIATPVPKLGMLGKGILGAVGRGAAYGAGYGALQNPGDTEGEVSGPQIGERLENAAESAKTGAMVGGGAHLGQAVGKGMMGVAEKVKDVGLNASFKSAGGMLKDFRQAAAKGDIKRIGQFMNDEGLIKAGDTVETVAAKAKDVNKKAGEELDRIYKKAAPKIQAADASISALENEGGKAAAKEAEVGFNPVAHKEEILKAAKEKLGDAVDKKSALKAVSDYLDDLAEEYGDKILDPRKQNDIKTALDQKMNYSRNPMNKQPDAEKAFKAARDFVAAKVDASVDALGKSSGDAGLAKELKAANQRYGTSKQVYQMAADRTQRVNANQMFGLTDRIAGGAGGAAGALLPALAGDHDVRHAGAAGVAGAVLSGAINHGVNKYGSGLLATGAAKLAPVLEKTLQPTGNLINHIVPNTNVAARLAVSKPGLLKKKGLMDKVPTLRQAGDE